MLKARWHGYKLETAHQPRIAGAPWYAWISNTPGLILGVAKGYSERDAVRRAQRDAEAHGHERAAISLGAIFDQGPALPAT